MSCSGSYKDHKNISNSYIPHSAVVEMLDSQVAREFIASLIHDKRFKCSIAKSRKCVFYGNDLPNGLMLKINFENIGGNVQGDLLEILQAVIQGLKRALKFKFMKPPIEYTSVLVITDSKYVIGIMEGNKPKTNLDLIQELFDTRDKLHCKVGFEYVSAHTKKTDYVSSCNNVVDGLASAAAERLKKTGQTEIKHCTIKMSSK
jgi:ribonuclease HI